MSIQEVDELHDSEYARSIHVYMHSCTYMRKHEFEGLSKERTYMTCEYTNARKHEHIIV